MESTMANRWCCPILLKSWMVFTFSIPTQVTADDVQDGDMVGRTILQKEKKEQKPGSLVAELIVGFVPNPKDAGEYFLRWDVLGYVFREVFGCIG